MQAVLTIILFVDEDLLVNGHTSATCPTRDVKVEV
jgi:hypothetical protein